MMKEVENQLKIRCEDEKWLCDSLRVVRCSMADTEGRQAEAHCEGIPDEAFKLYTNTLSDVKADNGKVQWASHATAKWGTIPYDEGNAVELCAPKTAIGCTYFFCDIVSLAFPDHKMAPSISVERPYM